MYIASCMKDFSYASIKELMYYVDCIQLAMACKGNDQTTNKVLYCTSMNALSGYVAICIVMLANKIANYMLPVNVYTLYVCDLA